MSCKKKMERRENISYMWIDCREIVVTKILQMIDKSKTNISLDIIKLEVWIHYEGNFKYYSIQSFKRIVTLAPCIWATLSHNWRV